MIVPNEIELDNPTPMKITVNLEDADGTTQSVTGVMKISGSELNTDFPRRWNARR